MGSGSQLTFFAKLGDDDVSDDQTTSSDMSSDTGKPPSCDAISDEWNDSDSFMHHKVPVGVDLIAAECLSYIRTALDRLAWLSLAIRKAGSKYRFRKADKALDESAFTGFRVYLTRIILKEVCDLDAASLSTSQIMDLRSDHRYNRLTAIQKQLIRANILRRNCIECTIRNSGTNTTSEAKPRVDSLDDEPIVTRPSSAAGTNTSSLSRPSKKRAMGSATQSMATTAAPAATHTAAHTATSIESHLDVNRMLSGPAPSAASNLTRVGATQAYPRCPKPGQDRQIICPYCLDVLPSSYSKSEKAWK